MESITQKHNLGCGIACVAFVTGYSYDEITQLLQVEQADTTGFMCRDLVGLLARLGFSYEYRYAATRQLPRISQDGSIVLLKRSALYPAGHYLARKGGVWMDPWINFSQDQNIAHATSGFRHELPYPPSYVIFSA